MKNADKPAYPIESHGLDTGEGLICHEGANGLTKRERFAMAAMQGLLASNNLAGRHKEESTTIANSAINYADELLRQLEETQ